MLDARLLAPQTTRALRREEYDRLVAMGAFEDERVELRDPSPTEYRTRTRHGLGETLSLLDFPDVRVEIAKLF